MEENKTSVFLLDENKHALNVYYVLVRRDPDQDIQNFHDNGETINDLIVSGKYSETVQVYLQSEASLLDLEIEGGVVHSRNQSLETVIRAARIAQFLAEIRRTVLLNYVG